MYHITSQEVLERISRHCPESLCAYLQCINRADDSGHVVFSRKMIEEDLSEGFTKFQNAIKKLALENLLEWRSFKGGIAVTLAAIDEDV